MAPRLPCWLTVTPDDLLDTLDAAARWAPVAVGVLVIVLSVGYRVRMGRWPWRWP